MVDGGTDMSELKPCPFCGSDFVKLLTQTGLYPLPLYKGYRAVVCQCGAFVKARTEEEAIERWNRRKE